ncbi:DNA repair protein XRCC3 [Pelomyxa schiedti]|nr:DNA repair protein XRCC3 [Pelomyxa schiedti]
MSRAPPRPEDVARHLAQRHCMRLADVPLALWPTCWHAEARGGVGAAARDTAAVGEGGEDDEGGVWRVLLMAEADRRALCMGPRGCGCGRGRGGRDAMGGAAAAGGMREEDVEGMVRGVAADVLGPWANPIPLSLDPQKKLSTGCEAIDQALGGGIDVCGITELFGESAAGKTQLCMQLCLQVQLGEDMGGLGGSALYFHSDGVFPIDRLTQMASTYEKKGLPSPTDKVLVKEAIRATNPLLQYLCNLDYTITQQNIKLIVIDSLAALTRYEYEDVEEEERASKFSTLWKIAEAVHRITSLHAIPVIIVNQVTDWFHDNPMNQQIWGLHNLKNHVPTLGLMWSHCVNTRLMLSRTNGKSRRLDVCLSPRLDRNTCHYRITAEGIVNADDNDIAVDSTNTVTTTESTTTAQEGMNCTGDNPENESS